MNISEHVKGTTSRFTHYRAGNLYYQTSTGLEFAVPVADLDGATVEAEVKSLVLMRWIRQHLTTQEMKGV